MKCHDMFDANHELSSELPADDVSFQLPHLCAVVIDLWLVMIYDLSTLSHMLHFCHMPHPEWRPATTSACCCNWFVICNNVKFACSSSCPFYARTNAAWCPQLTSIQAAPMESSQQPHLHAVVNRFVTCCDLWFVICHLACRLCHERVWPDLLGKPREKATVCSTSGS